jgi:hypothetical protein
MGIGNWSERYVKIHLDMTGKELAKPDFAMLRAGLAAAQATTPTAAASDRAHAHVDLTEALTRLFGDRAAGSFEAATLHGSFNPASLPDENDDRTKV